MARIVWTNPALADLQGIIDYIAADSPSYATRIGISIVESPKQLIEFPFSGRIVPEFQDTTIRELLEGTYRIIYQIRGDVCFIVAIVHGSRDLILPFSEDDRKII